MIFKATVSNKAHPEFGQATIPFPIPDSEYDHTIDLLEDMGISCKFHHNGTSLQKLGRKYYKKVNPK